MNTDKLIKPSILFLLIGFSAIFAQSQHCPINHLSIVFSQDGHMYSYLNLCINEDKTELSIQTRESQGVSGGSNTLGVTTISIDSILQDTCSYIIQTENDQYKIAEGKHPFFQLIGWYLYINDKQTHFQLNNNQTLNALKLDNSCIEH